MDGLSRASGAGVPITIDIGNGTHRDVMLEPLQLRDYGVVENQLLMQKRADLMRVAGLAYNDLPKEIADRLVADARIEGQKITSVSVEEVRKWLDTRQGVAFATWVTLDRRYPGQFTREQVAAAIDAKRQEAFNDFLAMREQIHAEDHAGNSNGPASAEESRAAVETATRTPAAVAANPAAKLVAAVMAAPASTSEQKSTGDRFIGS